MFEEMEKVPTLDQFRETFEKIRAEEQQHIADKKLSLEVVKTASEDQDTRLSKQDNIVSKQKINKKLRIQI